MIGITLDILLATLLVAAIFMGLRLERRLRILREGQADFAKAVSELNSAAARTETGLIEVRTATMQAQTTLADHTRDARAAAAKLEQQAGVAVAAARRLEEASQRAAALAAMPRPAPARTAPDPPADVAEEPLPLRRAALSRTRPEPEAAPALPETPAARWIPATERMAAAESRRRAAYEEPLALLTPVNPRSRARIDDDLFETSPAAAIGGRR